MKNSDQPAFPKPYVNDPHLSIDHVPGLTKREYFAAMAMQGLVQYAKAETFESIAVGSIKMADALLKELETPE